MGEKNNQKLHIFKHWFPPPHYIRYFCPPFAYMKMESGKYRFQMNFSLKWRGENRRGYFFKRTQFTVLTNVLAWFFYLIISLSCLVVKTYWVNFFIYETTFNTQFYFEFQYKCTNRDRRKTEENVMNNVMNRKDNFNIEYPLQRYCTDLKVNEILIYSHKKKWELNHNKKISRDNVNKKKLSCVCSCATYRALQCQRLAFYWHLFLGNHSTVRYFLVPKPTTAM